MQIPISVLVAANKIRLIHGFYDFRMMYFYVQTYQFLNHNFFKFWSFSSNKYKANKNVMLV